MAVDPYTHANPARPLTPRVREARRELAHAVVSANPQAGQAAVLPARLVSLDGRAYRLIDSLPTTLGRNFLLQATTAEASSIYLPRLMARTFKPSVGGEDLCRRLRQWHAIRHPNVLPLLTIGQLDRRMAAVMPWRERGSLDGVTADRVDSGALRGWITQAVAALEYVGQTHGFAHGGLSPSKLFMDPATGQVEIADWGVADLGIREGLRGGSGEVAGSRLFLAPERWAGEPACMRSDMFALGLCVFRWLTGSLPFVPGRSVQEQIAGGQYADTIRRALPAHRRDWYPWLARCTAPSGQARFDDYQALLAGMPLRG